VRSGRGRWVGATLSLSNGNSGAKPVYCWLALNPQDTSSGSPGTPFYYLGVSATLGPNLSETPIAVTDGVDVTPGTYTVGAVCWAYGVANISTSTAYLTVVATAR
jgi:hypothetical protein